MHKIKEAVSKVVNRQIVSPAKRRDRNDNFWNSLV